MSPSAPKPQRLDPDNDVPVSEKLAQRVRKSRLATLTGPLGLVEGWLGVVGFGITYCTLTPRLYWNPAQQIFGFAHR
jgi:hypothetical protein